MRIVASIAAALLLSLAFDASAQATRTWVSGVGDDANPCSRTAPCKTFAGAISKTAAGGEINVIDPGGYGAVTITKSITIDGAGAHASILAAGTNGVIINAAATDVVTLRNLSINGAKTGIDGVRVLVAKQVNIENCEIANFTQQGVEITSTMAGGNVRIVESAIKHTQTGIMIDGGNLLVKNSEISGHTSSGIDAEGSATVAHVAECEITMNGTGVRSASSATVRITHNDVMFNTSPWEVVPPGKIETFVDNRIRGTGTGALTVITYP